ncbi:MAG: HEAT repeat domain-containing protein [Myxococcota bacterium]
MTRSSEGRPEEALSSTPDQSGGGNGPLRSRILLLECRLEQLEDALRQARKEADDARESLARSAAREAELAASRAALQRDLAEARAEILGLHRKLDRSEALRSELEGRLLSAGGEGPERSSFHPLEAGPAAKDRIIHSLRARLDEVLASRDLLFTRIAEWKQMESEEGTGAVDLAEFISELRGEILSLEAAAREREAEEGSATAPEVVEGSRAFDSRDEPRLGVAGDGPPAREQNEASRPLAIVTEMNRSNREEKLCRAAPAAADVGAGLVEALAAEVAEASPRSCLRSAQRLLSLSPAAASGPIAEAIARAEDPGLQASLLLLLGRTGDERAVEAIRPWIGACRPEVRAAAYEAACRLLDCSGGDAASYLRAGLTDEAPMVRRRCILSAAVARSLSCRPLLEPLRHDPDPEVRRLIRRILSRLPPADGEGEDVVLALTLASTRAT